MRRSILIATDLSMRSERALRRAYRLAAEQGAKLTVLTVVDEDLPPGMAARSRELAEEELRMLCDAIAPDQPAELRVEIADPLPHILTTMKDVKADLLVLGVHRPRAVWDLFYGTTMERIVRASRVPVLLVRNAPVAPYARVLSGVDMSPASAAALHLAAELAPEATMHAFHAVHVPYRGLVARSGTPEMLHPFLEEARDALDSWWEETDLPQAVARPEPQPHGRYEMLSRLMHSEKPDLLAIGAHGRGPLSPTLLGGFTEQILRDPPTDVLVVRH
ncbi:universal stress protein [Pseudooceanicola marinus]|uniref:universal stress protein n=1 Tax=Pseudooceanicola marinus TaxID=396013 RepID=UPI001CD7FB6B|nr:universal stress protein [Pseudooceanicola marinus]MCA1334457.1 universal stress protein [Pseudooceanicola marinus]